MCWPVLGGLCFTSCFLRTQTQCHTCLLLHVYLPVCCTSGDVITGSHNWSRSPAQEGQDSSVIFSEPGVDKAWWLVMTEGAVMLIPKPDWTGALWALINSAPFTLVAWSHSPSAWREQWFNIGVIQKGRANANDYVSAVVLMQMIALSWPSTFFQRPGTDKALLLLLWER